MSPTFCISTPTHEGLFPHEYVASLLQMMQAFPGRVQVTMAMSSFLPRQRDLILSRFLKNSAATHLLSVDSDIGWTPEDVQALVDVDVDLVSGCYARKDHSGQVPVTLAEGETWSYERLVRARGIPGGFFLMKRAAVARMLHHYLPLNRYVTEANEETVSVHNSYVENAKLVGEDFAFSRRWRDIGGEIWVHPKVNVRHVGRHVYLPKGAS